jgi:hypothetical protein
MASCAALQAITPHLASAQDQSADTAAARAFAVDGMKLADAGRCDQAIDKLARAEKLHHSAIVLGRLGECLVAQGRVVEGSEALRKMLREPLPPNPTPALQKAYERAQAALDTAKPQIASVTISVRAPVGVEPSVTIDGQAVPSAVLGGERPTDPGEHVIEATAPGFLKATTKFSVGAGRKTAVELVLERDPSAPVAAPPSPNGEGGGTTESPTSPVMSGDPGGTPSGAAFSADSGVERPPNRTAAYVVWGISGVALAVGAGFGILAMSDKGDLEDKCPGNVCPAGEEDNLDSAKRSGDIATIGLAAGAVGAVVGTVLFFTAGPSSSARALPRFSTAADRNRHPARQTAGLRTRAGVGLGNVQLAVDF